MKLGNGYTEEGDFPSSLETLRQAFVMASTHSKSSEDMEDYRAWSAILVGKAYLRKVTMASVQSLTAALLIVIAVLLAAGIV